MNLWISDVPSQLMDLMIPEWLVITRHYPCCYIFKLFPRDMDVVPLDQLYSGMAGSASFIQIEYE